MKKVANTLALFLLIIFVFSCGEDPKVEKVKKVETIADVVPEEENKEEKLNDNLTKITDPEKVAELRQKLLEEEAFKKGT